MEIKDNQSPLHFSSKENKTRYSFDQTEVPKTKEIVFNNLKIKKGNIGDTSLKVTFLYGKGNIEAQAVFTATSLFGTLPKPTPVDVYPDTDMQTTKEKWRPEDLVSISIECKSKTEYDFTVEYELLS